MNYFCVDNDLNRKYCVLGGQPAEVEDICYRLIEGIPAELDYPVDAEFSMSETSGGIVVPDYIRNPFGYNVISTRFKSMLEQLGLKMQLEFLPAVIVNHKGRIHSEEYFVMNTIGAFDCLDLNQTQAEIDILEPQYFQWIDKLVLCDKKMVNAPHLFRVKEFPKLLLVSEWLKSQVQEAGLTGIEFVPTGVDYEFS